LDNEFSILEFLKTPNLDKICNIILQKNPSNFQKIPVFGEEVGTNSAEEYSLSHEETNLSYLIIHKTI